MKLKKLSPISIPAIPSTTTSFHACQSLRSGGGQRLVRLDDLNGNYQQISLQERYLTSRAAKSPDHTRKRRRADWRLMERSYRDLLPGTMSNGLATNSGRPEVNIAEAGIFCANYYREMVATVLAAIQVKIWFPCRMTYSRNSWDYTTMRPTKPILIASKELDRAWDWHPGTIAIISYMLIDRQVVFTRLPRLERQNCFNVFNMFQAPSSKHQETLLPQCAHTYLNTCSPLTSRRAWMPLKIVATICYELPTVIAVTIQRTLPWMILTNSHVLGDGEKKSIQNRYETKIAWALWQGLSDLSLKRSPYSRDTNR